MRLDRATVRSVAAKRQNPEALKVAARIKALREKLALTQEQFAKRTEIFKREEITQAENGSTLAKTERWHQGIGRVVDVPAHVAADYLRGRIALEQLLSRRGAREHDQRPRSREQTIRDAAFWEKIPSDVIDDFFASAAASGLASMSISDALHFMVAMQKMRAQQPDSSKPAEIDELFEKKKRKR